MAKRSGRRNGKIPAHWVVEEALPAAGPIRQAQKKRPVETKRFPGGAQGHLTVYSSALLGFKVVET